MNSLQFSRLKSEITELAGLRTLRGSGEIWSLPLPAFSATYMRAQSCPTLCDPMDCSPSGSSVYGILQARILEWVAMPSSRGSSWPRDRISISCISCMASGFFTIEPAGRPPASGGGLSLVFLGSQLFNSSCCLHHPRAFPLGKGNLSSHYLLIKSPVILD